MCFPFDFLLMMVILFYATKTSKDLEALINSELQKVTNYCNLNKLSINMRKTKLYDNNISTEASHTHY